MEFWVQTSGNPREHWYLSLLKKFSHSSCHHIISYNMFEVHIQFSDNSIRLGWEFPPKSYIEARFPLDGKHLLHSHLDSGHNSKGEESWTIKFFRNLANGQHPPEWWLLSMCGTTMIDLSRNQRWQWTIPESRGLVALSVFRASLEVGEFSAHGLTHLPWLRSSSYCNVDAV